LHNTTPENHLSHSADIFSNGMTHHMLYVSSQAHRFCLPLNEVERLMLLMEIQTIPQAPEYFIGIMNLYGEAIPVIDLALRIGLAHKDKYSIQTPLVLISHGNHKAALIIDNIEGVKEVKPEQLRGEKLFQGGKPPVKASVTMPDGTALLLDTQRIIDIDLSELDISLELGEKLLSLCQIDLSSEHQSGLDNDE